MSKCYEVDTLTFGNAIFSDQTISATYIIHLKNNGRLEHIHSELSKIAPTPIVHIVLNEGFKQCHKPLYKQQSNYDLVHAFTYVFEDAVKRNYGNILILEDDFIFDVSGMHQPHHITNITRFVNTHSDKPFVLKLGALPILIAPCDVKMDMYVGIALGTHCVVYSKPHIQQFLKKHKSSSCSTPVHDWDIYHNLFSSVPNYLYSVPLCKQLFPNTENNRNWGSEAWYFSVMAPIMKLIIWVLNLHKSVYPGYEIMYFGAKLLFWSLVLIVCFLLWKSINLAKQHKQYFLNIIKHNQKWVSRVISRTY